MVLNLYVRYIFILQSTSIRKKEGVHYRIISSLPVSKVCVISPHGGKIEPGTSELVKAIAGDDFSWYLFEGIQEGRGNKKQLHIKGQLFDEPKAVTFVGQRPFVLALHGYSSATPRTFIGGRNQAARERIRDLLRMGAFDVPVFGKTPANIRGLSCDNICNRGSSHCRNAVGRAAGATGTGFGGMA